MKALIFALFFLISFPILADTEAKIKRIALIEDSDLVYIYPEGGVTHAPACHTIYDGHDYISFSMNRPRAKEYLAALLTSFSLQKTVYLRTANECIDQSHSATLVYFWIDSD